MRTGHPYAKVAKVTRRTRKEKSDFHVLFRDFRVTFASFASSPDRTSP